MGIEAVEVTGEPLGQPPQRVEGCRGLLQPLPWRIGAAPPPPPLATTSPPLLLLLNRRDRLAPGLHDALLSTLSPAEHQRHGSFHRLADQQRFLLARAALRQVLAHWLGCPPRAVAIVVGPHGKPHGVGTPAFNLSHSGDLILLAFHGSRDLGVDVEQPRPNLNWRPIARRYFPLSEWAAMDRLPAGEQSRAFLRAWCRLEARVKAHGDGLAGLERRHQPATRRPSQSDGLWDVVVPPGYAAAVALETGLTAPPVVAAGADHPSPPG